MAKKSLFTIVLTLMSWTLIAQTGTINGVAKNSKGETLPFATITIEDKNIGTTAKEDGTYLLKRVPTGTQTIIIQSAGYTTQKSIVDVNSTAFKVVKALRENWLAASPGDDNYRHPGPIRLCDQGEEDRPISLMRLEKNNISAFHQCCLL